jgi:hypothetical protein
LNIFSPPPPPQPRKINSKNREKKNLKSYD